MTKNPFINAVVAAGYIVLIVSAVFNGEKIFGKQETILIPMGVLALFVLSAAIMGYIFLYQPLLLLQEGNKKGAIKLFLKTIATFALIIIIFFGALFLKFHL